MFYQDIGDVLGEQVPCFIVVRKCSVKKLSLKLCYSLFLIKLQTFRLIPTSVISMSSYKLKPHLKIAS